MSAGSRDDAEWAGEVRAEHRPATCAVQAELIVCTTCEAGGDAHGGERLLAELRQQLRAARPEVPLALSSIHCLWACPRGCAVQLRAPERMGYVLGDLGPGAESARLLLAFTERYLARRDGVVLHPEWPDGLRGHFVCRIPPPR